MKIQKREIVKAGIELAVGAGIGIIANNAIGMVTPNNLNKAQKVAVKIGGFALVWMVSAAASSHVNRVVDSVADGLNRKDNSENLEALKAHATESLDTVVDMLRPEDDIEDDTDGR